MDTTTCPRCGAENPVSAMNCRQCRVNLLFAAEHPEQIERAKREAAQREAGTTQQAASGGVPSTLGRVGLGALCLLGGAFAIVPLFVLGEGTGSGVLAYAVLSVLFALVAFGLARRDPRAWWAYAFILCAPITLLSVSALAADYVGGAIILIVLTLTGAYLGSTSA
jgi:hypothetical protein